jgi:hypothetical protein
MAFILNEKVIIIIWNNVTQTHKWLFVQSQNVLLIIKIATTHGSQSGNSAVWHETATATRQSLKCFSKTKATDKVEATFSGKQFQQLPVYKVEPELWAFPETRVKMKSVRSKQSGEFLVLALPAAWLDRQSKRRESLY